MSTLNLYYLQFYLLAKGGDGRGLKEFQEAPPLRDTAKAVCLTPREPTLKEFVPIGHVALGTHVPEEDDKLNLPSEGVFWVHYLYVSYSLHGHGFGSATMDQIESVAVQEPLNARIMVLSTIEKETVRDVMKDQGFRPPAVSDILERASCSAG